MKAFKAEDLRTFTKALFMEEAFDGFLLREAEFRTCCSFTVNGRTERNWYTDEELENERVEEYTAWKKLRPVCFSLIRGRKTPSFFRVTFRLPPEAAEVFFRDNAVPAAEQAAETAGLYLNLKFEEGVLSCISAASLNVFPPDRALEEAWDSHVREFFRTAGLAVSEL